MILPGHSFLPFLLLVACSRWAVREQGVDRLREAEVPYREWSDGYDVLPGPELVGVHVPCWTWDGGGGACAPLGDPAWGPVVAWHTDTTVDDLVYSSLGPVWIDHASQRMDYELDCVGVHPPVRRCEEAVARERLDRLTSIEQAERIATSWSQVCLLAAGTVTCDQGFVPELDFSVDTLVSTDGGYTTCALAADGRYACWDHTGRVDLSRFADRLGDIHPSLATCALTLDGHVSCVAWASDALLPDLDAPTYPVTGDVEELRGGFGSVLMRSRDGTWLGYVPSPGSTGGGPGGCPVPDGPGRDEEAACRIQRLHGAWASVTPSCYLSAKGDLFCDGPEPEAARAAGL